MQIYIIEIDILGVGETFLNNDVTPSEIDIEDIQCLERWCNFKEG